jgi:hypothetical protein
VEKPTIWLWDESEGSYLDKTNSTGYEVLADVNDVLYIGLSSRFESIIPSLSVLGAYEGLQIEYSTLEEYTWQSVNTTWALDSNTPFRVPPERDWDRIAFSPSSPHAAAPPDQKARYWWKISISAVTTAATITTLTLLPYAYYISVSKVNDYMSFQGFNTTTTPKEYVVEDIIRRHESFVDWFTKRTWRPRVITDEYHNIDDSCIKLYYYPVTSILSASYYSGTGWETLTEGRGNDFYVDPDKGLLYFTRRTRPFIFYFYPGRWLEDRAGFKVSYIAGRTLDQDVEKAGLVEEVVLKRTVVDLLRSHDYAILIKGGPDRLSVFDKVRELTREAQESANLLARLIAE